MARGEIAAFPTLPRSTQLQYCDDSGFYSNIRQQFGDQTLQLLKRFSRLNTTLAKQKNRRIFLLRCKHSDLTPSFLNLKTQHITFNSKYLRDEFKTHEKKFKFNIINLTISDTFKNIKNIERNLTQLEKNIADSIPYNLFSVFMTLENRKYEKIFTKIKRTNTNKITNLIQALNRSDQDNTPWNDKYIKNISNTQLPNYAKHILSLGPKFSLPIDNYSKIPIHNIITSVEAAIKEQPTEIANEIRTKVTSTINNHKNHMKNTNNKLNKKKSQLINDSKKTKTFLKNNPQLTIARSDKSNQTIIMDSTTYNNKCLQLLSDQKTYLKIKTDPTNVTQNKNNLLIKDWKNKKYITESTARHLTIHNAQPPKFYALIKTHKQNMPARPIVSNNQAPLYNLSKFLANIMGNIVGHTNYYIKNSFEFKDFIDKVQIPDDYILISLDVTSLYTNIPINLIEQIIDSKWQSIEPFTTLPKDEFQKALKLTLTTNYFQFEGNFFKQLDGVAMGSPISSIIAQLVMEYAEDQIIDNLDFGILFYKRYVDDCLLAIPKDKEQEILNAFNAFHHKLQFTIESENNKQINFLDLTLIRENNRIFTKWYTKTVSSGRYLNFNSEHHIIHKNNVITAIIDRAIKLTSPRYRTETIKKAKLLLLKNNYPQNQIDKITKKRVHVFYNSISNKRHTLQDNEPKKYYSIPYISGLSERIGKIFQHHNINITHKSQNHIKQFFSKLKSRTPKLKQTHLIYEIPCNNCEGKYIGQTTQYLQERIKAHKYTKSASTALNKHKTETGHTFNYNEASILGFEHNNYKRNILEMIHINLQPNSVNSKSEINNLSKIYQTILN